MIQLLVIAKESMLSEYLASTLSGEPGLNVVRLTRPEPGDAGRYSVVVIVDDGDAYDEPFQFLNTESEDRTVLVIRVSFMNRNVHVFESYQLPNPEVGQLVELVREFSRRHPEVRSEANSQKKMNEAFKSQAKRYSLQRLFHGAEDSVMCSTVHATLRAREYVTPSLTT